MRTFRKRRRGGVVASFEIGEAQLLASLAGQVIELLRDRNGEAESDPDPLAAQLGIGGPTLPPEDPVLLRLLPDAYRGDEQEAGEFRRYTEQTLTSNKVHNAEALIASLVDGGLEVAGVELLGEQRETGSAIEIELAPDEVQAWLRSLTDIRLSLAVRLGIETEEDAMLIARSEDEATAAMAEIYDWLGYVQESLISALD